MARPKAEAFAGIAALFGADRARVAAVASELEAPAMSLLLEVTAIVAFGFGFGSSGPDGSRSRRTVRSGAEPAGRTDDGGTMPDRPDVPGPSDGGRTMSKAETLAYLRTLRTVGQAMPTQAELAGRTGRPKQTISDWLKQWERTGEIPPRRAAGRTKQIA